MVPARDWPPDPKTSLPASIRGSILEVPLKWAPNANSAAPTTHKKDNRYAAPVGVGERQSTSE